MKLYIFRNTDKKNIKSTPDLLKKCSMQYIKNTSHGSCDSFCGEVLYTDNGKPYFSKGNIRFSVSHSHDIWICVMSDKSTGVDIEKIRAVNSQKISKRFFSEEENEYLAAGKPGDNERFFEIWTAKEAYGKFLGIGISSGMLGLDTVTAFKEKNVLFQRVNAADGFICTVCTEVSITDDFNETEIKDENEIETKIEIEVIELN